MPNPDWSTRALGDLLAILEYIAEDNPEAAQALRDEILHKVDRLADEPKLYRRGRVAGTREMVVRPNYILVYRESPERVTVLRLLHAAQMWP